MPERFGGSAWTSVNAVGCNGDGDESRGCATSIFCATLCDIFRFRRSVVISPEQKRPVLPLLIRFDLPSHKTLNLEVPGSSPGRLTTVS